MADWEEIERTLCAAQRRLADLVVHVELFILSNGETTVTGTPLFSSPSSSAPPRAPVPLTPATPAPASTAPRPSAEAASPPPASVLSSPPAPVSARSVIASPATVPRRLHQPAWRRDEWTQDKADLLLSLRAAGQSYAQIAGVLATTAEKCKEKMKRLRRAALAAPASVATLTGTVAAATPTTAAGTSLPALAAAARVSSPPGSASHRTRRSARRRDTWTQERTDQLLALRAAGQSYAQIGIVLGTTASKCAGRIRRIRLAAPNAQRPGPPRQGQRWSTEDSARLERLCAEGLGWQAIAQAFPGRSAEQCRWRVKHLERSRACSSGISGPESDVDSS